MLVNCSAALRSTLNLRDQLSARSMSQRWILILVAVVAFVGTPAAAQDTDGSTHARKVIRRVEPVYPDLARRTLTRGTVKLIAVVAPNGSVKSVEPVGGNPVLLKAAQDAVMNWKYAPGPDETKELIELQFTR